MEKKESVYDMEDPGYHRIAFFPVLEASADPMPGSSKQVEFQIKSIIRQSTGPCPHQINRSKEEGDVGEGEGCSKCAGQQQQQRRCVSFYPTPHLLVYERTTGQTTTRSGSMPDMVDVRDIWLAPGVPGAMDHRVVHSSSGGGGGGRRRMTLVRQKAVKVKRYHLLHPSNVLILIALIGILAVFLMTKRKKKMDNPLDILMAFV